MSDNTIIDTRLLLEHIQALRNDMSTGFNRMDRQFKSVDERFQRLEKRVEEGFEEARVDRQGIHEDLDATIRMQAKHDHQIAVLAGGPLPEEY